MLNFLKEKMNDVQKAASRMVNRETAEAIVAVMTGVAYADGTFEPKEREKMVNAFRVHPVLAMFETRTLMEKFQELELCFTLDAALGHDACLKEIRDTAKRASEEQRLMILRIGLMVAKADGELEQEELAFLLRAAEVLGVPRDAIGV